MKPLKQIEARTYEADLPAADWEGINTFGPHSMIAPNQLRDCLNFDLFPRYIKSRRGSTNLQSLTDKLASNDVRGGIKWSLGTLEYVIIEVNTGAAQTYWWARITGTPTAFVQIAALAGGNLGTPNTQPSDMFVSGDKLFIFNPAQNLIIQWNGTAFVGRPMGMAKCYLTSLAAGAAVGPTGLYTVGVEFVYQISGVDIVSSSPNRKTFAGKLLEVTVSNQKITVTVDNGNLPVSPGDYWTHVRVWRSKRRDTDYSTPSTPIDIQGSTSELYPEQLITKASLVGAGYVITLSKLDSELPFETTSEYPIATISQIELQPMPAAYIGVYHRGRIWASQITNIAGNLVNGTLYFSNSAGDAYAEQWDPLNVKREERGDGQACIKLISFEADLIVLKEAKTLRVPGGDADSVLEVLDGSIGITDYRLAQFIPKVGICAIVNDQSEFRIFDYSLRWTNLYQGIEVSRTIRAETLAISTSPRFASFIYINGKLMISDGTGIVYVLNAKEGKGWSRYLYSMNSNAQLMLTFSKGSRALVISKSTYIVEIEKEALDTDISTASDTSASIGCGYVLPRFQSRSGRDILYMTYYSQVALLSSNLAVVPLANGDYWPGKTVASNFNFVPDVNAYPALDNGLEREYRFYMNADTPMRAQFIHYAITTSAPATVKDGYLRCVVDEAAMGKGVFDPFIAIGQAAYTPDWIDLLALDAGPGARDLSQYSIYDSLEGVRVPAAMTTYDRG